MTRIPLKFIKEHSYCLLENVTIFNGIAVFGDNNHQQHRTISFLNTLPLYIQNNLAATTDHKGTICFFWASVDLPHIIGDSIELPDGDIWSSESFFLS
jgi:hypothetical protein